MRITNATNTPPAAALENTTTQSPRTDGAASAVPAPPHSTQNLGLVPSVELLTLHAALRQLPSTREDLVAETVRRLAAGELRTPGTLEQTADAILQG